MPPWLLQRTQQLTHDLAPAQRDPLHYLELQQTQESKHGWMDGWVRVLRPFNSISVISRWWKGEHERLCAMTCRLGSRRISPPAGFEPATPWTEVGRANRSAMQTLLGIKTVPRMTNNKAASWQNQQNGMCTQQRLRSAWASAKSDQSLCCPHEESLGPTERTAKTLNRLGWFPGWSESSLGARQYVGFVTRRLK